MMAPSDPASLPHPSDPAAGAQAAGASEQPGEAELAVLKALAEDLAEDPAALLDLLRRLEQLHRAIQDGPFRTSLPSDRNRLFQLLEAMEDSGGWPYIPRLQLRTFMDLLQRETPEEGTRQDNGHLAA
jgi:hypothetical protein